MALNEFLQVLPNGKTPPRQTAAVLNGALQGKLNCLFECTLAAGATTTTFTEDDTPGVEKVGPESHIDPEPLTANAAAEKAGGSFWVSARDNGTITFTHANNGQTDRTFRCSVTG
jgi:predicted lipoprotein with Yx(FWY)xxD motif